jgi:hypothetical protein
MNLEEDHKTTVKLIRKGKWGELGITQPEARNRRYHKVGLTAQADAEGAITLSWTIGGESTVGATQLSSQRYSRGRMKSPLLPSRTRPGH